MAIGDALSKGTHALNAASELAAARAQNIAGELRRQTVRVTDRLKESFDIQSHALNTVATRTGEEIDRFGGALHRQLAAL